MLGVNMGRNPLRVRLIQGGFAWNSLVEGHGSYNSIHLSYMSFASFLFLHQELLQVQ